MSAIELQEGERNVWRIVQSLISVIRKWNATGLVSLRAGQTTTVVTKAVSTGAFNVSKDDAIFLFPTTANAAGALATTYVPVATVIQGGFTIQHANAVSVDRTFFWAVR